MARDGAAALRLPGRRGRGAAARRRRAPARARCRREAPDLALEDLSLALPDGRVLVEDAAARVAPGESVLVTGPSGSGKSTLFRAIAGIWPFGRGRVRLPAGARALFLPQRPYLPLGTLRRALCYPMDAAQVPDDAVRAALRDAGLGHLEARLDEEDSWDRRLSGGEQQRVALARALLFKPDWLFLDEATASLDPEAEAAFYTLLRERLPRRDDGLHRAPPGGRPVPRPRTAAPRPQAGGSAGLSGPPLAAALGAVGPAIAAATGAAAQESDAPDGIAMARRPADPDRRSTGTSPRRRCCGWTPTPYPSSARTGPAASAAAPISAAPGSGWRAGSASALEYSFIWDFGGSDPNDWGAIYEAQIA